MPNKTQLVLAVGAAGPFAGLIPAALMGKGIKVRALVRTEANAVKLRQQSLYEVVIGDLRDPASLQRAAQGVDGVFHIGPAFRPDLSFHQSFSRHASACQITRAKYR
jgi:uncharacterized protein YbjT (DUF2867 family)